MKKQDFELTVFARRFSELLTGSSETTYSVAKKLGLTPATISRYANGKMAPKVPTLYAIADIFDVNPIWLFGYDVPKEKKTHSPEITKDYITFPVIGEVAAGFNRPALEDWAGDTIDIPASYLKGNNIDDYFVLKVKGDSMYPLYHDGDKVLILKQYALNYSGQIAVVVYNDDFGTLKKVEYNKSEAKLVLIPINPQYPPIVLKDEALSHCKVLGIPKLLIREIEE